MERSEVPPRVYVLTVVAFRVCFCVSWVERIFPSPVYWPTGVASTSDRMSGTHRQGAEMPRI